ncbi:hypothetical protein KP509_18G050200 [Ceratopteris richardii]|uniref:RNA methyltransferase n=1 Tax=Ceratopteris richardii TaxID=49495 RepID=A0A8T2SR25_CERRI|nr:hypothetical protein KP509_18G050200 [Ceratopteris richardii]
MESQQQEKEKKKNKKQRKSQKDRKDESSQPLDGGNVASALSKFSDCKESGPNKEAHISADNTQRKRKKKKKARAGNNGSLKSMGRDCGNTLLDLSVTSESGAAHKSESDVMQNVKACETQTALCVSEEHHITISHEDSTEQKRKKRKNENNEGVCFDKPNVNSIGEVSSGKLKKQRVEEPEAGGMPHVAGKSGTTKGTSKHLTKPTFSMAVAGSIIDNTQSLQLATMLAGQIARAATIFRVDEVVVFDDCSEADASSHMQENDSNESGGLFMVRILKYLEVPQYLRKALVPMHMSLTSVGKLPPLDAPHHLRKHEWKPFREGVVLNRKPSSGSGSFVDVGLDKVVDRDMVRQAGLYWGYTVRYARCLSAVFDECPYEGKYDYSIGTSEHGEKVKPKDFVIPKCKHLLVAFGGLSGLEESFELDRNLKQRSVTNLFDRYLNTCPQQGSRTIRTEEAILISLQFLQSAVQDALHTL